MKSGFALGVVSLVSLVAAIGFAIRYQTLLARAIDDSGEPQNEPAYVVQFHWARLGSGPTDRQDFITALGKDNVIFRHNMVIVDSSCDSSSLGNYGLDHPNNVDPCKQNKMGQQVTQRVGFKNKEHLRDALSHLANQP